MESGQSTNHPAENGKDYGPRKAQIAADSEGAEEEEHQNQQFSQHECSDSADEKSRLLKEELERKDKLLQKEAEKNTKLARELEHVQAELAALRAEAKANAKAVDEKQELLTRAELDLQRNRTQAGLDQQQIVQLERELTALRAEAELNTNCSEISEQNRLLAADLATKISDTAQLNEQIAEMKSNHEAEGEMLQRSIDALQQEKMRQQDEKAQAEKRTELECPNKANESTMASPQPKPQGPTASASTYKFPAPGSAHTGNQSEHLGEEPATERAPNAHTTEHTQGQLGAEPATERPPNSAHTTEHTQGQLSEATQPPSSTHTPEQPAPSSTHTPEQPAPSSTHTPEQRASKEQPAPQLCFEFLVTIALLAPSLVVNVLFAGVIARRKLKDRRQHARIRKMLHHIEEPPQRPGAQITERHEMSEFLWAYQPTANVEAAQEEGEAVQQQEEDAENPGMHTTKTTYFDASDNFSDVSL